MAAQQQITDRASEHAIGDLIFPPEVFPLLDRHGIDRTDTKSVLKLLIELGIATLEEGDDQAIFVYNRLEATDGIKEEPNDEVTESSDVIDLEFRGPDRDHQHQKSAVRFPSETRSLETRAVLTTILYDLITKGYENLSLPPSRDSAANFNAATLGLLVAGKNLLRPANNGMLTEQQLLRLAELVANWHLEHRAELQGSDLRKYSHSIMLFFGKAICPVALRKLQSNQPSSRNPPTIRVRNINELLSTANSKILNSVSSSAGSSICGDSISSTGEDSTSETQSSTKKPRGRPPKEISGTIDPSKYQHLSITEQRYKELREKNNEASRKCRRHRRHLELKLESQVEELSQQSKELETEERRLIEECVRWRRGIVRLSLLSSGNFKESLDTTLTTTDSTVDEDNDSSRVSSIGEDSNTNSSEAPFPLKRHRGRPRQDRSSSQPDWYQHLSEEQRRYRELQDQRNEASRICRQKQLVRRLQLEQEECAALKRSEELESEERRLIRECARWRRRLMRLAQL